MLILLVVVRDEVDEQGGRPGEMIGAVTLPATGVKVFVKAEPNGKLSQVFFHGVGFFLIAVCLETLG